jgi:Domain of Unknown Function with PDB structure (DUF3857)/Transglutaminase-like superfamily
LVPVLTRVRLKVVFLLLLFLFCCSLFAFAATDWAPISPAELQMKDLPEQPGAPAFILYHEEVDNDQQHFHSVYLRIKVLTEAGRKYGDVQIPYDRYDSAISDVHGRTIHSDGTIVEFQGKPFDKDYIKSKTVKVKMKSFSLPDVQVGSVLEFRYTIRYGDYSLWAPRWVLQGDMFQRKQHFMFLATAGEIRMQHGEIGRGLAYTWMLPKDVEVKNSHDRYELDVSNMLPFVEEEHMPPSLPFKYYVRFYYRSVANSDQFWSEEGKYWSKDVEHFVGKKGGVAEAVAAIVAPGDSPEQKVKKIYAYVNKIDNLTYHPKRTEQEQKVLGQRENRGAEDVLHQQFGDRDDITRLFVAMARAAGVPAWVMLVTDRGETLFEPKYLSMDQLNAEIAIVQLNGKDVFLDPGTKFCPYGVVYWGYSATQGIRQTASGGTEIAQTPMPDYMAALTKRVARLRMDDHGQVEGTLAAGFFGQEALLRRLQGQRTDDVGRTKILEDEAKSWFSADAQISVSKQPDWNAVDAPLVVEYKVSSPMLVSAGKRLLMPCDMFEYDHPVMFAHNDRIHPIYFEYPNRKVDDVRITLPDDLAVDTLPGNESARLDFAIYKAERKQDKNVVSATRDLAIATFAIGPSEYKQVKGFYDKVKEYDDQQVLLKRVSNVAQK